MQELRLGVRAFRSHGKPTVAWAEDFVRRRLSGEYPVSCPLSLSRPTFSAVHAATGLTNKELAKQLAISEATVKVHLTHIFQKLGIDNRKELPAALR